MRKPYDIVILGLSITSSWGNGHATTWRALIKGLHLRGRHVLFLEREQPWYASNRDLHAYPHCDIRLYKDLTELREHYSATIASAGAVIVGSYVPDGIEVCRWVLNTARGISAFYDIDTPVTLANLQSGRCAYVSPDVIPEFALYLSFTAGPVLQQLQSEFGAQRALPFYCSVDVDKYRPLPQPLRIDLGYMGTYSDDRQPKLKALLLDTAQRLTQLRFLVAGAQYPREIAWPANVRHVEHLPPTEHRRFYCGQRFTLNLTRADMVACGYSPSVRLFEAAACGVPIISDDWPGLDEIFLPNHEILIARTADDVVQFLQHIPEVRRLKLAAAARQRVLTAHSGVRRALELELHLSNARARSRNLAVSA